MWPRWDDAAANGFANWSRVDQYYHYTPPTCSKSRMCSVVLQCKIRHCSNVVMLALDPAIRLEQPSPSLRLLAAALVIYGANSAFLPTYLRRPHPSQYHHERLFEAITCRRKCTFLANGFVAFAVPRGL